MAQRLLKIGDAIPMSDPRVRELGRNALQQRPASHLCKDWDDPVERDAIASHQRLSRFRAT